MKRANSLLLTGRQILAEEGAALGFINEVVPSSVVMQAARRWAEDILKCSPAAIRATKAIANDAVQGMRGSMERMMSLPAVKAIASSPDLSEGARAFAERRAPNWSNPGCDCAEDGRL
jgi:enoyl-CoA hydratase/carnithine racemase